MPFSGRLWLAGLAIVLMAALLWAGSRVTLSALSDPGPFEAWAAGRVKRWAIGRQARTFPPPVLPTAPNAAAIGEMRFRGLCAPCHGNDGRSPTDIGRSMHPRAVNLGAPGAQSWSDAELFWIIKHGVRLTGMPGFGRVLEEDEIRALVVHVRSLATKSDD
jgi:mono/diheme cytochrome c family protein